MPWKEAQKLIEPVALGCSREYEASIAISLKRIADALEKLAAEPIKVRRVG